MVRRGHGTAWKGRQRGDETTSTTTQGTVAGNARADLGARSGSVSGSLLSRGTAVLGSDRGGAHRPHCGGVARGQS